MSWVTDAGTVAVGMLTAAGALRLRRDTNDRNLVRRLLRENADLRADLIDVVSYLAQRRLELASQGVTLAEPPPLRSLRAEYGPSGDDASSS